MVVKYCPLPHVGGEESHVPSVRHVRFLVPTILYPAGHWKVATVCLPSVDSSNVAPDNAGIDSHIAGNNNINKL